MKKKLAALLFCCCRTIRQSASFAPFSSSSIRVKSLAAPINVRTTTTFLLHGSGNEKQIVDEIDSEFWTKQQSLVDSLKKANENSLKGENQRKFAERQKALLSDTFYFIALLFCILWGISPNPFTSLSYAFGASFGVFYIYGLSRYVESLGSSTNEEESAGAGLGQARYAFLFLLFIFVGKFRENGLEEIPAIAGFFTYQLASLSQGLRQIDD